MENMRQGKILISWERFVAFLFSLSPFLSLYRFPFIGVNVAFFPYLFLFVITIVRGGEKTKCESDSDTADSNNVLLLCF